MKIKINKKSNLYYVQKTIYFPLFGVSKVHMIDEDNNEFIALVKGMFFRGYVYPENMKILEYSVYSKDEWDILENGYEYEKAIKVD